MTGAPDWLDTLREACRAQTQRKVAQLLGYSTSVISQVLSGKYPADLGPIEAAVRGALMGETVMCPVLAEIPRSTCIAEQRRPVSTSSPIRIRLWRACRGGCPHGRLQPNAIEGAADAEP